MLSDVYFPRVNGVSSSIRTFARELLSLGHEVSLVAPSYGEQLDHPHHDEGFEVRRVPSRTIFFDPEDRLMRAADVRALHGRLAARDWDVIHVHTPFRAHGLGVRIGRLTGAPMVETYHTYFEEYVAHYLPWLPRVATRFAARTLSRRLCHEVDHLIVPSREMTGVLDRYGIRTPSTVIPTGIHLDEFRGGDGVAFRARHGIRPDQPTIVTVSRLAQEKNIAFLLRMAKRLVGDFPDLCFVIAGEGPDAPRLKQLATELGIAANVRFFGNLDRRTTLLDCYRAGDAFVFASPTETQGLVLVEAMALGVPIVSTAVMGTATVLEGAACARIAREDEADFAAQIAAVLRDPGLRAALAAAGPADAQRWSAPVLMRQVETLYAGLSGRARHPATA